LAAGAHCFSSGREGDREAHCGGVDVEASGTPETATADPDFVDADLELKR
jgi:hypothetical protein